MSLEPNGAPGFPVTNGEHCELANNQSSQGFAGANRSANTPRTLVFDATEPERDTLAPPPVATDGMFYGLLGRLARQAAQGTEVNPVAAMAATMTWLCASMGRNPAIAVGDDWHHLRLFTLHVGRSSRGGKGMALGLLKRVNKAIGDLADGNELRPKMHTGGLSSREGLALLIHDGYREGKEEIPAIEDKRLFVVESEFANVLAQGKRDGNTLSTCLRDLWDGSAIKPATKSCRVWATRPHVALHGSITPTELRAKLASNDLSNGFANRFLIVWGERAGVIPFPSRPSDATVKDFAEQFAAVIRHGLSGYPAVTAPRLIRMSRQAAGLYADCYREFAQPHPAGELIAGLLQRRAPMMLRMAALFAITDLAEEMSRAHIEAARAWMTYFAQSVQMIFSPVADAEGEARRNEDAEKLFDWLRESGDWKARTAITRECFGGHESKTAIDTALDRLALESRIERREAGDGARKRTEYRAAGTSRPMFADGSQVSSQAQSHADIECSPVRNVRTQRTETTDDDAACAVSLADDEGDDIEGEL